MCTRSSRAASSAGDGARICTGADTGVGVAAARSIALSMSSLVTWPCKPLPAIFVGSTPLSAAILRTDGGIGISRGCGCRRRLGGSSGALLDLTEQRANRNGSTILHSDIGENARGRRRHLQGHLIGFKFDQRLVHCNRVACLFEPFADRRFGY